MKARESSAYHSSRITKISSMLFTLLDILKIATTLHRHQTTLSVIPIRDIITELELSLNIYSKKIQDDLARIIQENVTESTISTSGITKIIDIYNQDHVRNNERPLRFDNSLVHREIDELLGLVVALASEHITHIEFSPKNMQIFRFIQTLTIVSVDSGFETYLISAVPSDTDIVTINADTHALLKRIEISYSRTSAYPRMNIRIPSMNQVSALQNMRMNWTQTDIPEDDLEIYNYDQKKLGKITTRSVALPYTIRGGKVSVRIPHADTARILMTDILSKNDEVISRCVKLNI
ncbi:MAG: hypothetical protein HC828_12040 [Blastochloris sp.]|nr:hypothetical protein [Blastochloris sp.]